MVEGPVRSRGFWSGFRSGLGFMSGVLVVLAVAVALGLGGIWWAFGSLRGMAVAGMTELSQASAAATRKAVEDARAEVGAAGGRIATGAADAALSAAARARDAGGYVAGTGVALGERAAAAGASARERAAGFGERLGWRRGAEKETSVSDKSAIEQPSPNPSAPVAQDASKP